MRNKASRRVNPGGAGGPTAGINPAARSFFSRLLAFARDSANAKRKPVHGNHGFSGAGPRISTMMFSPGLTLMSRVRVIVLPFSVHDAQS
jgi:hypothetical protein